MSRSEQRRSSTYWPSFALLTVLALLGGSAVVAFHQVAEFAESIDLQFRDSVTAAPSQVYARPLVLHLGLDPVRMGLAEYLHEVGYRATLGPNVQTGEFAMEGDTWVIGIRPFRHAGGSEPGATVMASVDANGRIATIRDASGAPLRRVRLEPPRIGSFGAIALGDRRPVSLDDLPPQFVAAVLEMEDRRFFEHGTVDFRRIGGALVANIRAGRIVQGASTITQQLAKAIFLSRERTFSRKLKEIWIAWVLESRHTKSDLLEAYLNEIYLGQHGSVAIHGAEAGARHYFGKSAREMDLSESALLAGLIRAPTITSPLRDRGAARRRRDFVLGRLLANGTIDEDAHRAATAKPLLLRTSSPELDSSGYFVDYLGHRLAEDLGREALERGGLEVYSSLDSRLQALAENTVRGHLVRLENERTDLQHHSSPLQAAMLVIEPRTGQLLALVGGRDHSLFPFNRAISARRQPASVFKPVVALAALAKGGEEAPAFTLASVLSDTPMHVRTSGGDWYPTNHDRRYRGDVTLRQALEQSLNVPMARLGVAVGPTHIIAAARRLGIESPLAPLPSLPLGTFEVRLIEMTRAYGVLAAGGRRAPLRPTLGLVRPDGARFELPTPPTLRVYRASEVYLVTSALQGVIDRGTGTAVRELGYQGAIAGKTGSSDDFRDAWFVGYTPDVVVGVWVGFDDNHPVGLAGSAAALPIAMDFLVGLLGQRGGSAIRPPPGIERTRVRIREGGRCRRLVEVFLSGTAPAPVCDGGGGEP